MACIRGQCGRRIGFRGRRCRGGYLGQDEGVVLEMSDVQRMRHLVTGASV